MPRLNTRGDVLCGGGGERGSLNGTYWPFVTIGGGQWYTDNLALVQLHSPQALALVDVQAQTPIVLQPPRGANSFAAGGGTYLAQLAGLGLYGDVPAILPAAGLPQNGVGRDGTRVYTPDAQVGYGLHGLNPDGSTFDIPGANPFDVQVLGPSCVIWQHGAYGRPVPRPALGNASGVLLVAYHGQDWLLYWSEGTGVVLQPDGATEGWVLEPRPLAFARDLIILHDAIYIAWSVTAGERPQDLVICEVTEAGVTYPVQAAGWTPPMPVWKTLAVQPPDPEPEPPDPEPEPEPEPEPPTPDPIPEVLMIAYGQPLKDFAPGELVDNGNGTVSVKQTNGQFLCITPEGHVEERPSGGGPWESFTKGSNGLIANRELHGTQVCYVLPMVL